MKLYNGTVAKIERSDEMLTVCYLYQPVNLGYKSSIFDEEGAEVKRTIRDNINSPFTLHDMNVFSFEVTDNDIVMRTQTGMVETTIHGRNLWI